MTAGCITTAQAHVSTICMCQVRVPARTTCLYCCSAALQFITLLTTQNLMHICLLCVCLPGVMTSRALLWRACCLGHSAAKISQYAD